MINCRWAARSTPADSGRPARQCGELELAELGNAIGIWLGFQIDSQYTGNSHVKQGQSL